MTANPFRVVVDLERSDYLRTVDNRHVAQIAASVVRAALAAHHLSSADVRIEDTSAPKAEDPQLDASNLAALFQRRWYCDVFASGYHNGCKCGPSDPHDNSWGCGWRFIAPALTESHAARLGLTVHDTEEN